MNSATVTTKPLLIELFTEELPPKALQKLGKAFAEGVRKVLAQHHLLAPDCTVADFATPRRLAAHLSAVLEQAPEQSYTEKLMPAKIGLTETGEISPALAKKLAAKGLAQLTPADLVTESDGKQDYLYAKGTTRGMGLAAGVQEALDHALASLPIPKVMRYQLADGVSSVKFVRPAHSLLALWGNDVVPVQALGLQAGRQTMGHRFMCKQALDIASPDTYQAQLLNDGMAVASFDERRAMIREQLHDRARALHAGIGDGPEVDALLDEVTALVEHPTVYVGEFEERFLGVPPECLILTMRLNQKYFPLFEPATGKLTHRFLIVSNMRVDDPVNIIEGNQRVVRPRLADAQFFFETDRKTPLAERVESLAASVYHNKLGSQLERVGRIRRIARHIAARLGADPDRADRAALLAKADLNSNMVAEFPELQGIMGAYYAQADQEAADVVLAIRNQYRIRLDAPVTNDSLVAAVLFMAERLETLTGIWGIGLVPTGERDPYGLRRAALGLISAYEQLEAGGYLNVTDAQGLRLSDLLDFAAGTFEPDALAAGTAAEVRAFVFERYRNQLSGEFDRKVVDAVLALEPALHQVHARIQACAQFARMPEADSLAAANKRISNLLKKADAAIGAVDAGVLVEPAERALADAVARLAPQTRARLDGGDFTGALATMAQAKDAVDAFFNDVMVMADDPALRANRLALLNELHLVMNQVADISMLGPADAKKDAA
ncbi:glycine--tRNA ligase subunit beta [Parapusillimonas granuli]|uniref:Glycine--tRNA ligase beta subunit n=1 Tax=Parapusillimonas granuli TaxID=380911 RepID=A0A853FX36_9BURK|nr:glycine--tRNA ligase subunit beta [Parapusillimonas granuli]MBB5213834.1 glycyl-tRNA synthetase beta chain [Parapusillimonas granuli]NYT48669.1 glycine--tRNA ligase subunit beta [Parapusillimonas granuli]